MSDTLALTKELIARHSVTPCDAGCQSIISERLKKFGFAIEFMHFGEVANLWARHGDQSPLLVFAGHTDVVSPGPATAWDSEPFTPTERAEYLYGRGACDMKSGLAAMVVAAERFIQKHPDYAGSIAFLLTSDEEGPSLHGTKRVIEELNLRNEAIDYCIIGEATSERELGDQIRIGRRGSLHGKLTVIGKQSHIAYPHIALNPIHLFTPALNDLIKENWDNGNEFFPPTSFQVSNIHAGTGSLNVIPGTLEVSFNFRFSNASTVDALQKRVTKILEKHDLTFDLQWTLSGNPFLTTRGKLITATQHAIKEVVGLDTQLSTGGGTSDGRFIAPTGAEVVELGPNNASAHQVNEHVRIADLDTLTALYERILMKIFL